MAQDLTSEWLFFSGFKHCRINFVHKLRFLLDPEHLSMEKVLIIDKPQNSISIRCFRGTCENGLQKRLFCIILFGPFLSFMRQSNVWLVSDCAVMAAEIEIAKNVACVAGVNGKGEGEREGGRKMGLWELGTRERLLQRPPFFHLRPPIFR